MKKILFAFGLILSMTACTGNSTKSVDCICDSTDTSLVDSVVVDSISIDTIQ